MDTDLSSSPVMTIELPSTSVQIKMASSTRPVQMDIGISSRPVMNSEHHHLLFLKWRRPSLADHFKWTQTYLRIQVIIRYPSMPLTATEKMLKDVISEVKAILRKARNTNKKLRTQTMMAEKNMKSSAYQMVKEKMTPAAQTFFAMQIKQFAKKPAGRCFTLDEKVLCLSF